MGVSSSVLGAGRMTKDDPIDHAAGIVLEKKTGDYVAEGEILAWLHTNDEGKLPVAEGMLLEALTWGDGQPEQQPLIYGVVR